jgi:hypothetical protein
MAFQWYISESLINKNTTFITYPTKICYNECIELK